MCFHSQAEASPIRRSVKKPLFPLKSNGFTRLSPIDAPCLERALVAPPYKENPPRCRLAAHLNPIVQVGAPLALPEPDIRALFHAKWELPGLNSVGSSYAWAFAATAGDGNLTPPNPLGGGLLPWPWT